MNQVSESSAEPPDQDPGHATAQILPFERPPTSLQRAVQARAQEALELDRERRRTKPAPLRWAIILLLALIPVIALVLAVDAFVRVFHRINDTYLNMPVPEAPASEPQPAAQPPTAQEPGVVMLESLTVPENESPANPAEP